MGGEGLRGVVVVRGSAHSQQGLYFFDMGFFLLSAYITQGHRLSQQWNSISARFLRAANER